ncbi:DUF2935 domain-containing protein [Selenihalanaerobacter shriftii]|uniref:DUF2935 domain-containing protein n=1 Tax=Selenihalanaerobacter shriftii TaxID=142842 RepID=A0A1T4LY83_9FIRM|nr:DUF2935 domain-containing protein [Selenihalanaerobacter shriftii]SJZ59699.1 protein of unknown function [Selenihalanaerobacter shriftii]
MKKERIKNQIVDDSLNDIRFWVARMKEHALFIKLGLPADRVGLREEAQDFIDEFEELEERLNNVTEINTELLQNLIDAVSDLIGFKQDILNMLVECELRSSLMPSLVDHLISEAIYFQEILINTPEPNTFREILQEEVFWLQIMEEHVEFIIHLLDPSEKTLLTQAEQFREIFSRLLEIARDLESMAESLPDCFNTVIRFTNEVIEATTELRDFKAAAHELVEDCQVLSTVPTPILTAHVRLETDKFLEELDELKDNIPECDAEPPTGEFDFETLARNNTDNFRGRLEERFFGATNLVELTNILDEFGIQIPSRTDFNRNIVIGAIEYDIDSLNLENMTIQVVVNRKQRGYHLIKMLKNQLPNPGNYTLEFVTTRGTTLDRDQINIES